MNPLAKSNGTPHFDPAQHDGNTLQAFTEFIESWEMWYDVASIGELKEDATDAQKKEHKAKVFRMCAFTGERLKTDLKAEYNQDMAKIKSADFDDMVKKLHDRYQPAQNQVLLHYQFHQLKQEPGEKIDAFINKICQHADKCAFKCTNTSCTEKDQIHKTLIRDQIIIGTNIASVRENALEKEHDLASLISTARKIEATEEATKLIDSESPSSSFHINCVEKEDPQHTPVNKIGKRGGKYSQKAHRRENFQDNFKPAQGANKIMCCAGCGKSNCDRGPNCAAKNAFCNACGKKGHFSAVCLKMVKGVSTITSIKQDSPRQIHAISSSHKQAEINIGKTKIQALIDTGAEVNILLESSVPKNIRRIFRTPVTLQPYGSAIITPKGQITLDTTWNNTTQKATWIVIGDKDLHGNPCNLISCKLAESLGLISFNSHPCQVSAISSHSSQNQLCNNDFEDLKNKSQQSVASILSKYEDVFTGLGKLKASPVHFHLKPNAKPIIQPPRQIPYHLQPNFEKIIHEMERDDVIEQHYGPVTWLANPVLVPKPDGNIRITVDLRGLNQALEDPHLPIPRVEDILPMFNGKSIFSKLDLKTAFHQLELDTASRPLTVFRAGDRLMRYKRLTMGTLPASGELNQRLRPILANIPNAAVIQDDIVIAATDFTSHNTSLERVLAALANAGLTVSPKKCILAFPEIPFWGFRVTKDGIRPDPQKVQAVRHAERPQNKDEVKSFLCMIRSKGQFIPDLAAATANLRELTRDINTFVWSDAHETEFQNLKKAFNEDVLLRHYDTNAPTFIFVDAHYTGLSAILTQGASIDATKAVAIASRTTTDAEKNYSQLDLEATAIDFGLRQFRHILVGGPPATIVTDQQPLVSLWTSKRKPPSRIERILLRHQDINHRVVWRKGKDNPADYTSRHAIPIDKLPACIKDEAKEHQKLLFLLHQPIRSSISEQRLHQAQLNDRQLERLRHFIALGQAPQNDPTLRGFSRTFSELSIGADDIIYRGDKILLPQSLHDEIISLAHAGSHAGQDAVKRRIRAHFWFPSLDIAVKNRLETCHECQIHTRSPIKVPLSSTPIPDHPWDSVSLDLFGPLPDKSHILVSRCNLSRFPDAKVVRSTSAQHVLPALGATYNNFGNPLEHKADNGPPFNSQEFKDFSTARGISVKHSYPYHPQGNEAECFMKPLGKAVKVALDTNKPVQEAVDDLLIDYRSTPHPATGLAPGDMLFRGGYHSRFPKRPPVTEQHIKEAKKRDKERKTEANAKQNASRWRQYPNIIQGNEVLAMRFMRKFKSFYEKTPYIVTDVKGTQYTLLSCDTKRPRQPIIRHASQIKLYQQPAQIMPPHYRPAQTEPQQSNKAYDLPSNTRRRNNQRNATQNEPLAHPASNSQVPNEVDMPPPLPGPVEDPVNDQDEAQAIEPEITFCHPQQQILGEGRSKTGRSRKNCKNK